MTQTTWYYLYRITNTVNGKIYVGVHKTKNLNDGYMGSGTSLLRAQKKYGIEHFVKDILEWFSSKDEMFAREKELVTEEFALRADVYNIIPGGHGSWDAARAHQKKTGWCIEDYNRRVRELRDTNLEEYLTVVRTRTNNGREKALTAAAREKKRETYARTKHSQGKNNSQYGKMWITNNIADKKISKDEIVPEGWRKGRNPSCSKKIK